MGSRHGEIEADDRSDGRNFQSRASVVYIAVAVVLAFWAPATCCAAEKGVRENRDEAGLALPYSDKRFATLEEYIEHRAKMAEIGAPTLREVGPDRFVEEFRDGSKRYYKRAELLQLYGFER